MSPETLADVRPGGALGTLLSVIVLGALAFHGGYGIVLASRKGDNARTDPRTPDTIREHPLYGAYRRSSFGVLAFIALHFVTVHLPRFRGHVAPTDDYDQLVQLLSSTTGGIPLWAMTYSVGWALTAFHAGFGWFAAAERWSPRVLPGPRRAMALFCALVAGVVWFVGFHAVLHLSNGTRWWGEPRSRERGRCEEEEVTRKLPASGTPSAAATTGPLKERVPTAP